MKDLIIVGGGPAALAAAAYALGKHLDVAIVMTEAGGWAGWRQTIVGQQGQEYLAGEAAVKPLEQHVLASGHVVYDRVTTITHNDLAFAVVMQQHGTETSRTVLVATGATPNALMAPGAREFQGHGLAYSVATHAHLLQGKTVAVIGTTPRALRGVAELATVAQQVVMIRPSATGLQSPLAAVVQHQPNVELLFDAQVKEVTGGQELEEIVVAHNGALRRIAVDAVFVDLGLHANSGMVRELLDLAPGQFIGVDEHGATRVPGLFAAGDVTTERGEQIMIAIGDGARAALSAYDYLLAHTLGQRA
jgi:alkyl hydroperoxide reductase subunit F